MRGLTATHGGRSAAAASHFWDCEGATFVTAKRHVSIWLIEMSRLQQKHYSMVHAYANMNDVQSAVSACIHVRPRLNIQELF